jgi:hypothetical protein
MTRTLTTNAVKRIITKGLTGWQAGKLVLQDMIDAYCGRGSALTESDKTAIRCARMEGADVRDYNRFVALCRGFHGGYMLAQWACADACLEIGFLEHMLRDADKRRTVELFESCGPHVVTRKQYDEIVVAQRRKKLEYEYSLGYVIEERFYAIAPPEARKAIDEAGVDIESVEHFVSAVPKSYTDLCQRAINEIHKLHTSGKLPAVYHKEDAKKAEPLLRQWKKKGLKAKEVMKLLSLMKRRSGWGKGTALKGGYCMSVLSERSTFPFRWWTASFVRPEFDAVPHQLLLRLDGREFATAGRLGATDGKGELPDGML